MNRQLLRLKEPGTPRRELMVMGKRSSTGEPPTSRGGSYFYTPERVAGQAQVTARAWHTSSCADRRVASVASWPRNVTETEADSGTGP